MKKLIYLISSAGLPYTFVFFYLVGITLFVVPPLKALFFYSIPFSLLLAFFALLYTHKNRTSKFWLAFLLIPILGIVVEIVGVHTGLIFGTYTYHQSLGLKLADVPLLIGINWMLLVYCSNAMMVKFSQNKSVIVLGASLLMVCYDLILEFAAPAMQMWSFDRPYPPLLNFVGWFITSLVFQIILVFLKVDTKNNFARILFLIQIVFLSLIVFADLIVG
ncbi:MAG: carotenoid biosynthesis protein [Bacteroidota bacterium]|nr:MAG: carotenoid biosynthesis protein [Bacteroidota bacterium]